jgi:hypothetical protein
MTTLVVLGAVVFLPLSFIVPAVLWKWRDSRVQARLAEARRERQEAAERRLHGPPVSARLSPEAAEVWKEQAALRAALLYTDAERNYSIHEDYDRIMRERDPLYDKPRQEVVDLNRCESPCCTFDYPVWA